MTADDKYIPSELLEAISQLPVVRVVKHCGQEVSVSPLDFYAMCPACRSQIKLRSFARVPELEGVFDAVFTWMNQPGAADVVEKRRQEIAADEE